MLPYSTPRSSKKATTRSMTFIATLPEKKSGICFRRFQLLISKSAPCPPTHIHFVLSLARCSQDAGRESNPSFSSEAGPHGPCFGSPLNDGMIAFSAAIWLRIQAHRPAPLFVRCFSTAMSDFWQMPSDTDVCLPPSARLDVDSADSMSLLEFPAGNQNSAVLSHHGQFLSQSFMDYGQRITSSLASSSLA